MQVVYEKNAILDEYLVLALITAGSSRHSRVINTWTVQYRLALQTKAAGHASLDLVRMLLKIYSNMQHTFAYNGLPWRPQPPRALHF